MLRRGSNNRQPTFNLSMFTEENDTKINNEGKKELKKKLC